MNLMTGILVKQNIVSIQAGRKILSDN